MKIRFSRKQRQLIRRFLQDRKTKTPALTFVVQRGLSDTKGGEKLLKKLESQYDTLTLVKSDQRYRGTNTNLELRSVKSNFGTSDFIPMEGRRVVERTFSRLESYRRLCRNYERYLSTARSMAYIAAILFMMRG